jgi:hypothetical protein
MRSLFRIGSFVLLGGLLAGCYSLRPASGMSLETGSNVAFDVNDAGRLALGGAMGPEIRRVEGLLVGKDNGEYLVAVSGVTFLNGGNQRWTGERIHLKPEYVGTPYERRFSRGRTIALSAAAVGAVALVIWKGDLIGLGTLDRPPVPCDTCPTALRFPRP